MLLLSSADYLQNTVKPALSGHSKRRAEIGFQDRLLLNAGQKYCREHCGIFSTFIISYHLSLRPSSCLFFSVRLRQDLLYSIRNTIRGSKDFCHS